MNCFRFVPASLVVALAAPAFGQVPVAYTRGVIDVSTGGTSADVCGPGLSDSWLFTTPSGLNPVRPSTGRSFTREVPGSFGRIAWAYDVGQDYRRGILSQRVELDLAAPDPTGGAGGSGVFSCAREGRVFAQNWFPDVGSDDVTRCLFARHFFEKTGAGGSYRVQLRYESVSLGDVPFQLGVGAFNGVIQATDIPVHSAVVVTPANERDSLIDDPGREDFAYGMRIELEERLEVTGGGGVFEPAADPVLEASMYAVIATADFAEPRGTIDLADVDAFVDAFVGLDCSADLNADGLVDLGDADVFIGLFMGNACATSVDFRTDGTDFLELVGPCAPVFPEP